MSASSRERSAGRGGPFAAFGPFGPLAAFGFGPGHGGFGGHSGFGGPGRFRFGPGPRRRRRGRGDVRSAVLSLLAEAPMHGYQLIAEINERSGGSWRPSPGSVYPLLQLLEDEGLVSIDQVEGRRLVSLTDGGRAYVEEHRAELDDVWDADEDEQDGSWEPVGQLVQAVIQVYTAGTAAQVEAATEVLDETRRKLYAILAEDAAEDSR